MSPYRALRLLLLPVLGGSVAIGAAGCTSADTSDTAGTSDSGDTSDTADTRIETTACMQVDEGTTECPAAVDVDPSALFPACGSTIEEITGEGTLSEGTIGEETTEPGPICCYPVIETQSTCDYGRPFRVGGESIVATPTDTDRGWGGRGVPRVEDLSQEARAALAERWTLAALDEHAAIAAFSRIVLDLLALGAPAELVLDTTRAAADEVRHARLGFSLASAYAGRTVAPGAFPFEHPIVPATDLVTLAVDATREGCIGETVSAMLAAEAAELAEDPAVREALATIARDEMRHSQLAWRTVRWAMETGGEAVRDAVAEVFRAVARQGASVPPRGVFDDPVVLARHGLLDRRSTRRVADRALAEVILPSAAVLLGKGDARMCA
jgi:hypothetical protein